MLVTETVTQIWQRALKKERHKNEEELTIKPEKKEKKKKATNSFKKIAKKAHTKCWRLLKLS